LLKGAIEYVGQNTARWNPPLEIEASNVNESRDAILKGKCKKLKKTSLPSQTISLQVTATTIAATTKQSIVAKNLDTQLTRCGSASVG
jgi:hypothetical protein